MRRVLVVEADRDSADLLVELIGAAGHTPSVAGSGEEAVRRVKAWSPAIVVLSDGALIPRLRSASVEQYLGIVLSSADLGSESALRALQAGADDLLSKPFRARDLTDRIRVVLRLKDQEDTLREARRRIDELATVDELTGLLGFRAVFKRGEEEIRRCGRFAKSACVLVIDIDDFHQVNERHDFEFGSDVLREVVARIQSCLRPIDRVGRVGADEFVVVLPEADLAGAERVAQRIQTSVEAEEIRLGRHSRRVRLSMGLAPCLGASGQAGLAPTYLRAREALQAAKLSNNNKIEIHTQV